MKRCGVCGQVKDEKDFPMVHGKIYYRCKSCHSTAKKQSYEKNKSEGKIPNSNRNQTYLRDGFAAGKYVYF